MRIALDAVGGDFGLEPNLEGAIAAGNAWGARLLLVGPEESVRAGLRARGISGSDERFEVVDAPDLVGMDEEPAAACRAKPRASVMVCARLVAEGRARGFVSAGNSGATMVASLWHLKRVPGVLRPAIAAPLPTPRGVTILLDAGANVDSKPWHLAQFAQMGALLARHGYGVARPTVGILTIGEEEGKGNDLVKESFPLLKASGLDFRGCVEGRDIPAGKVDVAVCDGFTGNILIKGMEGTATAMLGLLKSEIGGSWISRAGALLLRGPFTRLKRRMSYDEYGGAPLVGVRGSVIVCHGASNAKAISNAIRVARQTAEARLPEAIEAAISSAAAPEGAGEAAEAA